MAREGGGRLGQGMETAAEKGNLQQGEELERAQPLLCAAGDEKLGGNEGTEAVLVHSLNKPRSELCPGALWPINLAVAGRKEQEDAQSLSLPSPQGISTRSHPCPSQEKLWL